MLAPVLAQSLYSLSCGLEDRKNRVGFPGCGRQFTVLEVHGRSGVLDGRAVKVATHQGQLCHAVVTGEPQLSGICYIYSVRFEVSRLH